MTLGTTASAWLAYHREHFFTTKSATSEVVALDFQFLVINFFLCFVGPFIYQALLEVSIAIAQPFSNSDAIVPTKRMLHVLEKDLCDARDSARSIRSLRSSSPGKRETIQQSSDSVPE